MEKQNIPNDKNGAGFNSKFLYNLSGIFSVVSSSTLVFFVDGIVMELFDTADDPWPNGTTITVGGGGMTLYVALRRPTTIPKYMNSIPASATYRCTRCTRPVSIH